MLFVRDGNDEKEFFVLLQNLFNNKVHLSLSLFTRACGRVNTDGDQYDDDDDEKDEKDDGFRYNAIFMRARSTKVYSDEVYFDETVDANAATTTTTTPLCRRDDEKCSHFLCGTSNVVVILLPVVLRIVDNFIPFYVGLIEMTRALETRSVVRALHV